MSHNEMKTQIKKMMEDNYQAFVMALMNIEYQINNEKELEELYQAFMDNDELTLLNDLYSHK